MIPGRNDNSEYLNDEILIQSLRDGHLQSVIQLYTLGRVRIIRHVKRNNGNSDEAEDIVQDAVILVYEKKDLMKIYLKKLIILKRLPNMELEHKFYM